MNRYFECICISMVFQSLDKRTMLVHKTIEIYGSRVFICITIQSNAQKTFFSIVPCTNMAAIT